MRVIAADVYIALVVAALPAVLLLLIAGFFLGLLLEEFFLFSLSQRHADDSFEEFLFVDVLCAQIARTLSASCDFVTGSQRLLRVQNLLSSLDFGLVARAFRNVLRFPFLSHYEFVGLFLHSKRLV